MDDKVMTGEQAIQWLKQVLHENIEQLWSKELDGQGFGEYAQDIVDMAQEIERENYAYVKVFEHPMSASGLAIVELVEKR